MNAFFKCMEAGGAECPLKELSKSVSLESISVADLNRSLAQEIAGGQRSSEGWKKGAEPGEASSAEHKEGLKPREVSGAEWKKGAVPGEASSAEHKEGLQPREVSGAEWKKGAVPGEASSAEHKESSERKEDSERKEEGPEGKDRPESEGQEKKELTEDEINQKQREAIKDALQRLERGEELTREEKGNLCEMMMDQYYISQGYKPLHSPRVTSLEDKGHHGIDGVYEKDGKYVIVDAKYGQARLGDSQDGTQMSQEWINKRLDDAVGKEKADEIREAYENDPNSVSTEVYHFDPGTACSKIYHVDKNGEKDGDEVTVEMYRDGERVELLTDEGEYGGANYG